MTVKELREELNKFPDNMEVILETSINDVEFNTPIEEIYGSGKLYIYGEGSKFNTEDIFGPNNKKAVLKELAEMLDGMELGDFQRDCHRDFAKKNNLVIVSGCSDDLIEFDGAIYDEGDCWDGGHVYFDKSGVDQNGRILPNVITAVWCGKVKDVPVENLDQFKTKDGDVFSWGYITDIPHVTFDIFDGEDPYCRGIIFSLNDVRD